MSLTSILKTVGKDLSHVGQWIQEGLEVAVPVVGAVDPPVGLILTEVETILGNLLKATNGKVTITPQVVQSITTAVSMLHGIKNGASLIQAASSPSAQVAPAPISTGASPA